ALSTDRQDRLDVVRLLLSFGADVQQRGVNDWTPLHYVVSLDDATVVTLLLAHGADPNVRTRIDDCGTPLEEAEKFGRRRAFDALKKSGSRRAWG
ncbi:MAG: ankyrin repeat domain-containing protein, partial [Roseiarcus sp.]